MYVCMGFVSVWFGAKLNLSTVYVDIEYLKEENVKHEHDVPSYSINLGISSFKSLFKIDLKSTTLHKFNMEIFQSSIKFFFPSSKLIKIIFSPISKSVKSIEHHKNDLLMINPKMFRKSLNNFFFISCDWQCGVRLKKKNEEGPISKLVQIIQNNPH